MHDFQLDLLVVIAMRNPAVAFEASQYSNDRLLFEVAVRHSSLWVAAATKLQRESIANRFRITFVKFRTETHIRASFQGLAPELHGSLASALDIRDLLNLGATCAFFRRECALVIAARMTRAFDSIGLDWIAVRFMLVHSDAIFAGWFVYHLARMDFTRLESLQTIDIYVRQGIDAKQVRRFLKNATEYRKADREDDYTSNFGVFSTVYYAHPSHSIHIAVHHCWQDPRETVMCGKLTCLMCWMCGKSVFIAYAELTLSGITMVSHAFLFSVPVASALTSLTDTHEDWFLTAWGLFIRDKTRVVDHRDDTGVTVDDPIFFARTFREAVVYLPRCDYFEEAFTLKEGGKKKEYVQTQILYWVVDGQPEIFSTAEEAELAWIVQGDPWSGIFVTDDRCSAVMRIEAYDTD
ncbi:hypothetical protein B0H12DRAFT_1235364 [Mycena haematopus]|nr:hypothetical protein B0H12DRAFT_1235364 [Mycena haematopus]